ncbi:FkbM family methyltransferase, partial [Candidatus Peregrinibacteria bacterium]|nr:FkbM family methyltransferase [Candidatus Peregrinibacteria bacterium]
MVIKHFKIAGRELSLNLPDKAAFWVFEEIFENRDYRLLDEILKSAKVVFDVGAHVGLFSIYAGLLNDRVKIYAFEPIEDNFLILKENLKKNGIKNVIAKNLALGSVSGMREIYVNEDSHNHS